MTALAERNSWAAEGVDDLLKFSRKASQEEPQLVDLTLRKFKYEGDVDMASRLVAKTSGVKKTMEVAEMHASKAIKAVDSFPPARGKYAEVCRDALRHLANSVVTRRT